MATSASSTPTVPELMAAGAHFGHKKHRSHPASRKYVFTVRDRVLVINLEETARQLTEATAFVAEQAKRGATMLFVGTKRQAVDQVKAIAEALEQPYVTQRWLGGMLTNFETIQARLKRMRELEAEIASDTFETKYSKKDRLMLKRELDRLHRTLGGIKQLTRLPDLLVIVDTNEESNALAEARRMNIPVVAIVDTNANPDEVTMPIVANDDSAKTIELIFASLKEAALQGKTAKPVVTSETPTTTAEAIQEPAEETPVTPRRSKSSEGQEKPAAKKTAAKKTTKASAK